MCDTSLDRELNCEQQVNAYTETILNEVSTG